MARVIGIYVFDEVEVMDFAGPFEVFSTASTSDRDRDGAAPPFEVLLIAEQSRTVQARGGFPIVCQSFHRRSPSAPRVRSFLAVW